MTTTRSLFIIDSFLGSQKGVLPYLYDAANKGLKLVTSQFTQTALQFYEASIIDGEGSWWIPTAPVSLRPVFWQDPIVPLEASGSGIWQAPFGEQAMRSQDLFWWIPNRALSELPITPAINKGTLSGDFPIAGPSA